MSAYTEYYAGVYRDTKGKVLQVSDTIDGLSCELLAEPGVRATNLASVEAMLAWGYTLATRYACQHLEVNCCKGCGSYQWHKVR